MDAAATMGKATGALDHAAAGLCGVLPVPTKLGRSVRNSQTHYRTFMRRASVKAANPTDNQFGSGDRSRVDAEMIVLRKRMHELRMQERNHSPPEHWMKWEKEWSVTYASDICQILRWLQNSLINTRPAIAIAAFALILLSVPAFLLLLLFQVLGPLCELAMECLTKLLEDRN